MNSISKEIQNRLFDLQDKNYKDFQAKLIPNINYDTIIGVRTPELRRFAGELVKDKNINLFLEALPHKYFEENQLHAFIISGKKDYGECMELLKAFLPYIDNWATCDQLSPKVFKKHKKELLKDIFKWIKSKNTYTVRFGTGMLMQHFLDEDFEERYIEAVSKIRSEEYYINMMTAWYFATALAKQYESSVKYIKEHKLDTWTHNKAIQKALESRRVSDEHKEYLRTLKITNKGYKGN